MNSVKNNLGPWTAWWKLGIAYGAMSMAATEVIWRRSMMMAQGAMSATEASRMLSEKSVAFSAASSAATIAAAAGKSAAEIAAAALRPYGRGTRANVRRLGR